MDMENFTKRIRPYLENCSYNLGMDELEAAMFDDVIEWLGMFLEDSKRHMKFCGDCLNNRIRSGDLIPIEEWWARNRQPSSYQWDTS